MSKLRTLSSNAAECPSNVPTPPGEIAPNDVIRLEAPLTAAAGVLLVVTGDVGCRVVIPPVRDDVNIGTSLPFGRDALRLSRRVGETADVTGMGVKGADTGGGTMFRLERGM